MSANPPISANRCQPDAGQWLTAGRFTLLLSAIIGARFAPVLLGRESFYYRDYGLFTFPIAHYFRECFWRGEFPLWNPYNNCGVPLLAQWNSSLLYPPSLFYLLLPLVWALAVFQLAHLVFGGAGMFLLARKWTGNSLAAGVAGLAFALNGLSLHMLMWISNLAAYAWMPWVALAAAAGWSHGGRSLALAVLAGAMQMLSGAPELIILTWIFVAGVWLADWRRRKDRKMVFRLAVICGLITAVAAAQLLPFVQLLAHSQRSAGYSDSRWAMPGWGWANFLVPLFHCSPSILGIFSQDAQQWTASYYLGAGVFALALRGILDWRNGPRAAIAGLTCAALAGIILAMGENAPFYGAVKAIFPQLSVMRYPIKLVVMTALAVPLLAAYGVAAGTTACSNGAPAKRREMILSLGTGLGLIAITGGIIGWAKLHPVTGESPLVTEESGMTRMAFLVLILGAVILIGASRDARTRRLAAFALLLLVALDALTQAPAANPTIPVACYGPLEIENTVTARLGETRALLQPALETFLSHAATPDATSYYTTLRRALFLNVNLIEKIPTPSGFFSLELGDYATVKKLLYNGTDRWPQPLADFIGVAHISGTEAGSDWTNGTGAMPLVTAGQAPRYANRADTLKALAAADFQPRSTVYLPLEASSKIKAASATGAQIIKSNIAAQKIELEVTAENPALVVIAQAFYAPWTAYVDGQRVNLWEANGAFQALEIPAGRHQVKIAYEDFAFKSGAGISLAGLAATGAILLRGRNKRRGQ